MPISTTIGAGRLLAFTVRHINASAREPISSDAFLAALADEALSPETRHHLQAFFDEVELETLSDLVSSGALTYPSLARQARQYLAPGHDVLRWLDDRT